MSMFSQASFRRLSPPASSSLATEQAQVQLQDDLDPLDPGPDADPEYLAPHEVQGLLLDIARRNSQPDLEDPDLPVHHPVPRHHTAIRRTSDTPRVAQNQTSAPGSMERYKQSPERGVGSSPVRTTAGGPTRHSPSPSRPHHLTALSPLQAFSPLQSISQRNDPIDIPASSRTTSEYSESTGGRSRSSSVTRSLSRKESVYAQAAKWRMGDNEQNNTITSRLILVKAPSKEAPLRRRAKSSSALAPFSSISQIDDTPATTAKGPRRSFAAASFASFTPLRQASLNVGSADAADQDRMHYRAPGLGLTGSQHNLGDDVGIHRKILSPEEVVEFARSLTSPVLASSEPSLKGAELKRRKSSGSTQGSFRNKDIESSPGKQPAALEPVDYVELDDDTLLPYVDRPHEVAGLVANPVNEQLFALLRAAFPKHPARPGWKEILPTEWSWDELLLHLTKTNRDECPDYAWVLFARDAVRRRSVALWEKLGICLGCNGDLLTAGSEDNEPATWDGLGDDVDYDPSESVVFVEGLEAVDPATMSRAEKEFAAAFGEPVAEEDEEGMITGGMSAMSGGMATIGEGDEETSQPGGRIGAGGVGRLGSPGSLGLGLTTAQRAGNKVLVDPMTSPSAQFRSLSLVDRIVREEPNDSTATASPYSNSSYVTSSSASATEPSSPDSPFSPAATIGSDKTQAGSAKSRPPPIDTSPTEANGQRNTDISNSNKIRSKSFVGLQILTSPTLSSSSFMRSPTMQTPTSFSQPYPSFSQRSGSMNQHATIMHQASRRPSQGRGSIGHAQQPMFERGPGSPMFVPSFNALSLAPNLGRSASAALGAGTEVQMAAPPEQFRERKWRSLNRKASGAGLSESAITFASESEVDHE